MAPQVLHVRHDQPVLQPHAQARLHDHSLLRLYVQWSVPSNENEVEWAKRATSLPRCSSTWDDSRNQPRAGEFVHHCVACQRRMLVSSRALSGQRSTQTSSVVAISDLGPLSGCGYVPTLTSSVVASVCNRGQRHRSDSASAWYLLSETSRITSRPLGNNNKGYAQRIESNKRCQVRMALNPSKTL